jgi:hypothetical protein
MHDSKYTLLPQLVMRLLLLLLLLCEYVSGTGAFVSCKSTAAARTLKLMPAPKALNWSASCIANSLQDNRWRGSRSACMPLVELPKCDASW